MKLTEATVRTLEVSQDSKSKDSLFFDDQQRGLAVRVTRPAREGEETSRTYIAQYSIAGKKWRVPLGACSALSLSKARSAAAAVMGDVAKGRNPALERKEATKLALAKASRERLTLDKLIEDWERLHLSQRRSRYATEAVRALRYAFADDLSLPAGDLDRSAVVRVLDGLRRHKRAKDNGGNTRPRGVAIASRTAAYGHAAYEWARKRGAVRTNPFESLPTMPGAAKRERVLSDDELLEVWTAAGEASAPYGAVVRLLLLTGQRKTEVAEMTWGEIADDLWTWTIPGTRTKNGVPHVVPLSKAARDLLRGLLPQDDGEARTAFKKLGAAGELVFPGNAFSRPFAGWSKAKRALDAAISEAREKAAAKEGQEAQAVAQWHLHDLRRTLATGFQRLGVRLEVTEAVLNHISGSRAGIIGVYQRHNWADEKRAAMDAWGAHVTALAEGTRRTGNVTELFAARLAS